LRRRYGRAQEELIALFPELEVQPDEANLEPADRQRFFWDGVMPGMRPSSSLPNRQILYAIPTSEPDRKKVWWVSRFWYRLAIAFLIAAAGIPCLFWLFRERTADWIARNRVYAWMLIGLIWWTSLELSLIGLAILAAALIAWLIRSIWLRPQQAAR